MHFEKGFFIFCIITQKAAAVKEFPFLFPLITGIGITVPVRPAGKQTVLAVRSFTKSKREKL